MADQILFLLPYPLGHAPSQRFRVEAFFSLLHKQHISFRTHCFLNEKGWRILYKRGSALQKVFSILKGFLSRLFVVLFIAPRFTYIFIHREAAPLGPPVFEWLLVKVFRKKIIYDFDDAIWIPAISQSNRLAASVKCFWKTGYICRWSFCVSAGNDYLANFAKQYSRHVLVMPTCVDTEARYNYTQAQDTARPVIGWTGSHSTLPYLDAIVPVLQRLEQQYDFDFLVICNQEPRFSLRSLRYLPWQEKTEIADLLRIHIGVMPLQQDAWSEGKCGFKIIQYLALGIPAVASPVGVNKEIIEDGVNGFCCTSEQDWYNVLSALLQNASMRQQLGEAGKKKIVEIYSIQSHAATFLSLFKLSEGQ